MDAEVLVLAIVTPTLSTSCDFIRKWWSVVSIKADTRVSVEGLQFALETGIVAILLRKVLCTILSVPLCECQVHCNATETEINVLASW